jgi:isoquinoline 1-oxidoreductase alpha subunit
MANYTLNVNGKTHQVNVDEDTPLLWVLRDNLNLYGAKYGCGVSLCGTCMIHIDGEPIKSCVYPVSASEGKKIKTIEGLSEKGTHPVQQAWIEHDVPQCGYCQAGQIMTAAALLEKNSNPSDDEISEAMNGNICRCGTYNRIKAAVKTAAEKM